MPDHDEYITNNDFNKYSGKIFDERSNHEKLAANMNLDTFEQHGIKNEEKIENMQLFDLSYFLSKKIFW